MTNESDTLALAIELIEKPSITPHDAGCIPLLTTRLNKAGFQTEILCFGDVDNLWVKRGEKAPLFVFLGHTDVVPPGNLATWHSPPFSPTVRDGSLYGRGAVDMKGSIAAMVVAMEQFVSENPEFPGSIALLLTSDEEGPAINGTRKVVEVLNQRQEKIDWCIVGEPSSTDYAGDKIRNGRRGSLSADLIIHGIQGHVAYPQLAKNPIHAFTACCQALIDTIWDEGNAFFPPTQLQIVDIHAGDGTYNVIPGDLSLKLNFRYSSQVTAEQLQTRVTTLLNQHHLDFAIQWRHSAQPFLTTSPQLLEKVKAAIFQVNQTLPQLATDGGTSDGRFIAPLGTQVIELGLCNRTIHQVNETVALADLTRLTAIYYYLLKQLFLC